MRYINLRLTYLLNQLPDLFRQPHHSCLDSPPHPLFNSSLSSSPLSSSITPPLFQSRLKTNLFNKSFPTVDFFYLYTGLPYDNGTGPDLSRSSFYFQFHILFISCGRLSWLPVCFLLHVKYTLSYRIVQQDPKNPEQWTTAWVTVINPSKCYIMSSGKGRLGNLISTSYVELC